MISVDEALIDVSALSEIEGEVFNDLKCLASPKSSTAKKIAAAQRLVDGYFSVPVYSCRWPYVLKNLKKEARRHAVTPEEEFKLRAVASLFLAVSETIDRMEPTSDYLRAVRTALNDSITVDFLGPTWRYTPAGGKKEDIVEEQEISTVLNRPKASVASLNRLCAPLLAISEYGHSLRCALDGSALGGGENEASDERQPLSEAEARMTLRAAAVAAGLSNDDLKLLETAYDGNELEFVANKLGITKETAYVRLHRARVDIRPYLQKEFPFIQKKRPLICE